MRKALLALGDPKHFAERCWRLGAAGLPVTVFYDRPGARPFVHQGAFHSEADLCRAIERYALQR